MKFMTFLCQTFKVKFQVCMSSHTITGLMVFEQRNSRLLQSVNSDTALHGMNRRRKMYGYFVWGTCHESQSKFLNDC
jgi:hypothetical protein